MNTTSVPKLGLADLASRIHNYKLVLLAVVTLINSFISLTFALVTTWAGRMNAHSSLADVLWFCVKGLLLYLIVYLGLYLTEIVTNSILKEACVSLEVDCLRKYLATPNHSADEIVSIVSQDVRMIRENYYIPILTLPTYLCRSLIPIIYLLTQNLAVGICFAVGAGLMMLPQHFMAHGLADLGSHFSQQREYSLSAAIDLAKGKTVINNHQAQPFFLRLTQRKFEQTERAEQHLHNTQALMFSLSGPLKGIADVVPFALGIYLMRFDPRITIVLLVAMLGTAGSLKNQFQEIIYLSGDLLETKAVRAKIGTFLHQPTPQRVAATPVLSDFAGLTITDVSKKFADHLLFAHVDLSLSAGQKILITGKSGVGKSTFLDLLMQNQQPDSGTIYLRTGGKQPQNITNFQQNISLIAQQPHLFNLSIRDNICLGKPIADAELMTILKQVDLSQQLGEAPLDFLIQQNGANISGGQRLKIEIARALADRKQIILADEITASLDPDSAKTIHDLLLRLPVTVIEVAHHYTNLDYYDQIWRFADQTVRAQSTDLAANKNGNHY